MMQLTIIFCTSCALVALLLMINSYYQDDLTDNDSINDKYE